MMLDCFKPVFFLSALDNEQVIYGPVLRGSRLKTPLSSCLAPHLTHRGTAGLVRCYRHHINTIKSCNFSNDRIWHGLFLGSYFYCI